VADAWASPEEIEKHHQGHIVSELGLGFTSASADELRGWFPVTDEMLVPGTGALRQSILVAHADVACGLLAVEIYKPRVPVTVDLSVHLFEPLVGHARLHIVARPVKKGESMSVLVADITDDDGVVVGVSTSSFMKVPNPNVLLPEEAGSTMFRVPGQASLAVPFAERSRCRVVRPGVAELPKSPDGLNAAGTINGALLGLVAEEAALSLAPETTLSSLDVRYLRPVRVGPAVATAEVHRDLVTIAIRDRGAEDKLALTCTGRLFR
jgi:acyl-coenzyme A thioesterase PaaI-like protein